MAWETYQGVEVLEFDSTVKYRHPRLGSDSSQLAPLEGATLLALADSTFLVVCDAEGCGFNGITGNESYVKPEGEQKSIVDQASSLFSHINGKHRKTPAGVASRQQGTSRYPDAQLRVAIKIWLKWKATRIKNWAQNACDELERLGFEPRYAEKWTPDQLGSLVRQYVKRDQYKNIKAGPMDEADRKALTEMIREAAERASNRGGKTVLAANVRITEKPPPYKHTPVDFSQIISDSEAARAEQEEETVVPTGNSPDPVLNFAGLGASAPEPVMTMTLPVNSDRQPLDAPMARARRKAPVTVEPSVEVEESDYKHVVELPDGTPMFKYKDSLMVGKPVKGVEI